jgi:hypothetical protein
MRQQQHSFFKRDCQKLSLPEKIADQHHYKAEKFLGQIHLLEQLSTVLFEFSLIERSGFVQWLGVFLGGISDLLTLRESFGHRFEMTGTTAFFLPFHGTFDITTLNIGGVLRICLGGIQGGDRHVDLSLWMDAKSALLSTMAIIMWQ